MTLQLYNSKTNCLEAFKPIRPGHAGLYLCGPTVYDRAHIGNARSVVVFDVLRRLLERTHQVTYVRNITDIDDKIIDASLKNNITIAELTAKTTAFYHEDMAALGNLPPHIEPKATEHIPEMLVMIQDLVEKGYAYQAQGHVLFNTKADPHYGALSKRSLDDMIAGARVEVAPYKKNPTDFVLWKPSRPEQPGWESPYGWGRPGWHIECSAMSAKHLGKSFDIHGGGQDLLFPHHENEQAQSTCCYGEETFAKTWLHIGMLQVEGKKMSKSLGNFYTVQDLLAQAPGEAIRFALLRTHYRQPLNWQADTLKESSTSLTRLYQALTDAPGRREATPTPMDDKPTGRPHENLLKALKDDLNTPLALTVLFDLVKKINTTANEKEKACLRSVLKHSASLLGILQEDPQRWLQGDQGDIAMREIEQLIQNRLKAKHLKDYQQADSIRQQLLDQGIHLEDTPQGTTWRRH